MSNDLPDFSAHPVVYQCDLTEQYAFDPVTRPALTTFMQAHGVNPNAAICGVQLYVRRRPDGTFYLDMWRAKGNVDAQYAPDSRDCGCCARQERVAVPLAAPVPLFGSVFVSKGVQLAVIDDPTEAAMAKARELGALPVVSVAPMDAPPDPADLSPEALQFLAGLAEAENYDLLPPTADGEEEA